MSTNYYRFTFSTDENSTIVCSAEQSLKKGDAVVVANYEGQFEVATVKEKIDELYAITHYEDAEPIISVLDLTEYNERRKAQVRRAQIQIAMNKKMDELKTLDTLKKFAGKDDTFRKMFDEYMRTFGEAKPTVETEEETF